MSVQVQKQLLEALKKIDRPVTFCTSGRLPSTFPGLEVPGVGPVALPLEKRQAAALKKGARQAPYGKGTETLVDTNVRRVWEIDADQIVLSNPEWADLMDQAIVATQTDLGLEKQKLEAHLYKLLLYEPGSFFLPHRDGEKLDRMVATLVIALPAAHEGGELVVRHEDREEVVDFSADSRFHTQFAAFYADCEHELRPVTSGFRLALVYNLTLARSARTFTAPQSAAHIAAVARILKQWKEQGAMTDASDEGESPSKLAIVLDHHYSSAGLAFDALKGIDRARANVLLEAASKSGFDASLALVTYWESGSAEPSGGYGYGRHGGYGYADDDDVEHEMGEVYDHRLTAKNFKAADGNSLAFGQIPLSETELVSDAPLSEGEPDKEEFEGYTGNAGMTLERWYHRAAVLVWPAESRFDVLCETGVNSAVGGLEQIVKHWKQATKSEQAAIKQDSLAFAGRIIARWPERGFASGYSVEVDDDAFSDNDFDDDGLDDDDIDNDKNDAPRVDPHQSSTGDCLLSLLASLGDAALIAAWIRGVLAKDVSVDPGKQLGDICQIHGWLTFQNELQNLFENTSNETLERHARLLADWSLRKDKNADRRHLCAELARQIASAVERWNPQQATRDWRSRKINSSELLPNLARSLIALEEPALFERLTTFVIDRPTEFDLTTVQIPALLSLKAWLKRNVKLHLLPLRRWLMSVVEELEKRASHLPKEPIDWRREAATGCNCPDCQKLSGFLDDPNTETLRLPLAKSRRQHLHQAIDQNQLDTTHITEHRGNPHTLVCTKTKASYDRAVIAHHLDLDHLAKIQELNDWHDDLQGESKRHKIKKGAKRNQDSSRKRARS
jgi:predicted 2-oxoglutarate/Fe(II)-dependent dioxygenase YbiX